LAESSACCWDTVGPAGAAGALVAGAAGPVVAGWAGLAGLAGAELAGLAGAELAGLAGAELAGLAGAELAGGAGVAAGWLPPDTADAMPPIALSATSTRKVFRTWWRLRGGVGVGVWSGLVWVVVVSDMVIPLLNR
jgi:hypothetical protein